MNAGIWLTTRAFFTSTRLLRSSYVMWALSSALLLFLNAGGSTAEAKELAIERARIQQAEDGAPVASNFKFLPGEAVYVTFRIAGFQTAEKEDEKRFTSLAWRVEAIDQDGLPLTKPQEGKIESEVLAEDREWLPKVSFTFELPQRMAGGKYRVVAKVRDLAAKADAAAELPFLVDGPTPPPAKELGVFEVGFFRQESDNRPLTVAAYQPGDPILIRFVIAGYKLGPNNQLDVDYGVSFQDPNGKVIVEQKIAAKDTYSSIYPCRIVPGTLNLTLSKEMPKGTYRVVVTARDHVGKQTVERPLEFSVE